MLKDVVATNVKMRERYVNFENRVRFGRILEDLDTMAGKIPSLSMIFIDWI